GPEKRIGTAYRHLQARQMDEVGDTMPINGGAQAGEVGDVACSEADLLHLIGVEDESQPARGFLQVVAPDLVAALQDVAADPGPNTTVAASEQNSHNWTSEFGDVATAPDAVG